MNAIHNQALIARAGTVPRALVRSGRAILWAGLSRFDGRPIALLCGGLRSSNGKTGQRVAQLTIVPLDWGSNAWNAVRADDTASVCGGCPKQAQGECYTHATVVPKAVGSMLRALRADSAPGCVGTYPDFRNATIEEIGALLAGRMVRSMQWGDAGSLPREAWARIEASIAHARTLDKRTGVLAYTHAWQDSTRNGVNYPAAPWLRRLHMASVSNKAERDAAHAQGWRTFRDTLDPNDLDRSAEIYCPATAEGGDKSTCDRCGLCAGASKQAKSIVLIDHGPNARYGRKTTDPDRSRNALTVLS